MHSYLLHGQGFPKKRPFLKVEKIPNLCTLSDDKEGKVIENVDL